MNKCAHGAFRSTFWVLWRMLCPPNLPVSWSDCSMIEALKSDEIVKKMGGRFKLTALIQRRLKELIIDGARPLVDRNGRTDLEIVIEEILQEKITADFSETGYEPIKTSKKR